MIHFACPKCKHQMHVPDELGASKLNCPACGQRVQVPMPAVPALSTASGAGLVEGSPPFPGVASRTLDPRRTVGLVAALVGVSSFLFLGLVAGLYILFAAAKKEKPPDPIASRPPVSGPETDSHLAPVTAPPPPRSPPEKFALSNLYQQYQRNPRQVKSNHVGKWITVDLEDRVWEVEDLKPNADGVIEIICYTKNILGPQIHLILRFSQSKDKIVSRMQQYAESRQRGEIVRFVVTGKLATTRFAGKEYLVLNDVALE